MTENTATAPAPPPSADGRLAQDARLIPRIILGVLQGLAIWLLMDTQVLKDLPILQSGVFFALLYAPTLAMGGLGQMRLIPLLIWAAAATVLLGLFGAYDAWRLMGAEYLESGTAPKAELTFPIFIFGPAALYIAHHLIAAADHDRRRIANYPTYFDIAWTSAVQVALASAFTLAFWLVLLLGAGLFQLIGISFFWETLFKPYVMLPLLGGAFGLSVHITDIRQNLARGMRTLVLTLLSWLLPIMTVIAVAFLIALPFTGLQLLWKTGSATALLLTAAITLTLLLNAAYQDGGEDKQNNVVFRWSSAGAAIAIFPLATLAAYAVALRVGQYGLTPERIVAITCVTIALVYAVGYLATLVPAWRQHKPLEKTNVAGAFAMVAGFIALFSPIADPARLAVESQVARLKAGQTAADKFDYRFLAHESGRFGRAVLVQLKAMKEGPDAARIAQFAAEAEVSNRYDAPVDVAAAGDFDTRVQVYPSGEALPDWFRPAGAGAGENPCANQADQLCNIYMIDLTGDGVREALIDAYGWAPKTERSEETSSGDLIVFQSAAGGGWRRIGSLGPICSGTDRNALKLGQLAPVAPLVSDYNVAESRLYFTTDWSQRECKSN
jgi:hypothetical protein